MLNESPLPPLFPFEPFAALSRNGVVAASAAPPSATMPLPIFNPIRVPPSIVFFEPSLIRISVPTRLHTASPEPPSMTRRDSLVKM